MISKRGEACLPAHTARNCKVGGLGLGKRKKGQGSTEDQSGGLGRSDVNIPPEKWKCSDVTTCGPYTMCRFMTWLSKERVKGNGKKEKFEDQ